MAALRAIVRTLTLEGLRDALSLRRWRVSEAGVLADKAAWWARQGEMERDPTKHDDLRNQALMFAAVARAMKGR